MTIKLKTILIFPNGSTSFYAESLTANNTPNNQYFFIKKNESFFFFTEDIRTNQSAHNQFLDNRKKYFK